MTYVDLRPDGVRPVRVLANGVAATRLGLGG